MSAWHIMVTIGSGFGFVAFWWLAFVRLQP
jgi:hypothetical protein